MVALVVVCQRWAVLPVMPTLPAAVFARK